MAKLTYASFAALYLYKRFKGNKKKSIKAEDTKNNVTTPQETLQLEPFTSAKHESSKDNPQNGYKSERNDNKEEGMHEATSAVQSNDSSNRPDNSPSDGITELPKSNTKISKTKFELESETIAPTTDGYKQQADDKKYVFVF